METISLPDSKFKMLVIRMFSKIRGKIVELSENFNKELENARHKKENLKKNKSKMENTTTKMRNISERINCRLSGGEVGGNPGWYGSGD